MRNAVFAALAALATAAPAAAQVSDALAEFSTLKPDLAVELAQATLASCREGGYQVAVAVVDRFGVPQAIIRDRFAGPHTIDTATAKGMDRRELPHADARTRPEHRGRHAQPRAARHSGRAGAWRRRAGDVRRLDRRRRRRLRRAGSRSRRGLCKCGNCDYF